MLSRKTLILKIIGILILLLAIFSVVACTSYLFSWKADQSLLTDSELVESEDVHNLAGKPGFKWAYFLVGKGFGLACFFLVFLMFHAAYTILFDKDGLKCLKMFFITVCGTLIFSTFLSFVGNMFSGCRTFAGGLGGNSGCGLAVMLNEATGPLLTFLILAVSIAVWLFLTSKRFAQWITGAVSEGIPGPKREKKKRKTIEDYINEYDNDGGQETVPEQDYYDSQDDIVSSPVSVPSAKSDPWAGTDPWSLPDPWASVSQPSRPEPYQSAPVPVPPVPASDPKPAPRQTPVSKPIPAPKPVPVPEPPFDAGGLEPIDVRADLSKYKFPTSSFLDDCASMVHTVSREETESSIARIREALESFKISVSKITAVVGPTVTLYRVYLAAGMKSASVKKVDVDLGMALGAERGVRVVILSDSVGIEVPNRQPSVVPFKSVVTDNAFVKSKYELPVALGYTIDRKVKTFDLADAPHLLVAGATKQGKSVGLNVIIASLLFSKHPTELKMVFIDPKMVEFTPYKKLLKHYLAVMPTAADEKEEEDNAIIKTNKAADEVLKSLCIEMDERYLLLSRAGVNNVKSYNEKYKSRYLLPSDGHRYMPYIVVVIDEYADLIMSVAGSDAKAISRGVSTSIIRLAQKGRAAGLHVIVATQRPSVDVVTPLIKANFPTRIAFRVATRFDSGTILDSTGAEKLVGKGDMLYYAGVSSERVQCAYISMDEIKALTKFIGEQSGFKQRCSTPYYLPELPAENDSEGPGTMVDMKKLDENFEEAARLVVTSQKGSTSDIQRRLGMGYARAGKVMDQLEAAGIVGPQEGSKPRTVLVGDLAELETIIQSFINQ